MARALSRPQPASYPLTVRLRDIQTHNGQRYYQTMTYTYLNRQGITKSLHFRFFVQPGGSAPSWNLPVRRGARKPGAGALLATAVLRRGMERREWLAERRAAVIAAYDADAPVYDQHEYPSDMQREWVARTLELIPPGGMVLDAHAERVAIWAGRCRQPSRPRSADGGR